MPAPNESLPSGHPPTASGTQGGCPIKAARKIWPWSKPDAPQEPLSSAASSGSSEAATEAAAAAAGNSSEAKSACPVKAGDAGALSRYMNPSSYDVYSRRIDPRNQMPANANNVPAPGQSEPLPTERVPSTIPKGGTEGTWTYPSPQMFWNALVRKGKAEGASEGDMSMVVAIHNSMNEATWRRILQWEELREFPVVAANTASSGGSSSGGSRSDGGNGDSDSDDGRAPRLLRFQGRPHDLSPKAWLKSRLLGCPDPFDRHDWVVDRSGTEIRYVIDYYHDEAIAAAASAGEASGASGASPPLPPPSPATPGGDVGVRSIEVDVRPALDSFSAAYLRLVAMPLARLMGKTEFAPLSLLKPPRPPAGLLAVAPPDADSAASSSSSGSGSSMASLFAKVQDMLSGGPVATPAAPPDADSAAGLAALTRSMQERCSARLCALKDCSSEEECHAAALALSRCMAGVACPMEAAAFDAAAAGAAAGEGGAGAGAAAEDAMERAFATMQRCLQGVEQRARQQQSGRAAADGGS